MNLNLITLFKDSYTEVGFVLAFVFSTSTGITTPCRYGSGLVSVDLFHEIGRLTSVGDVLIVNNNGVIEGILITEEIHHGAHNYYLRNIA